MELKSLFKTFAMPAILAGALVGCGAPADVTLTTEDVSVKAGDTVTFSYTAMSGFQEEDANFTGVEREFNLVSTDLAFNNVKLKRKPDGAFLPCSIFIFTDWECVSGLISEDVGVKVYRNATFSAEFKDTMELVGLINTKTSSGRSENVAVEVDREVLIDSILDDITDVNFRACVAANNAPGLNINDITSLDCSADTLGNSTIGSLEGIQYFQELTELNVAGQNLDLSWDPAFLAFSKLRPVFYLSKLETLNITGIPTDQSSATCFTNATTVVKMAEFAPNLEVIPTGIVVETNEDGKILVTSCAE